MRVCVIFDWMGSLGGRAWGPLRAAGVDVHGFNPPRFDSPLAWLSRDHRKSIVVDGDIGFVSGLCVSAAWEGNPAQAPRAVARHRRPDTRSRRRRPAARVRASLGGLRRCAAARCGQVRTGAEGDVRVHVVAGVPSAAGIYRIDLLLASVARKTLWLTDAYFVGTAAYTQALRAAARDGVDVRLLVPGAIDIPALSPLSRAGYRPLLDAGVRVFEWNGTMLHAKTAVADGVWARVGSTNLNLASWMGNYELDVAIEDATFAQAMAVQYEKDIGHATEILLTTRNRVRRTEPRAEVDADAGVRVANAPPRAVPVARRRVRSASAARWARR